MTLRIDTLSTNLNNIVRNTDFSAVENAAQEAIDKFNATKKTILGGTIGETKGGVQALTQDIDDELDKLVPQLQATVTRATDDVNEFVTNVSGSVSSNIEAITGKAEAVASGFLQEVISVGTPEGVNAALKKTTTLSTKDFSTRLNSLTTTALTEFSTEVDGTVFGNFLSRNEQYITDLNQKLNTNVGRALVDLGERLEKNFENKVRDLVGQGVPDGTIARAFKLVSEGDYDGGFDLVVGFIDVPGDYAETVANVPQSQWSPEIQAAFERRSAAKSAFDNIDIEISSYTSEFSPGSSAAGFNTLEVKSPAIIPSQRTGQASTRTRGVDTSGSVWDFSQINSVDELEALFTNVNRSEGREISGAIVHWSATFLDQDVDADWIHGVHINRGFSGCGYHVIIKRDGTLQRGRPLNRGGAHDINNNRNFLGFCFIGGINETSRRAKKPYWRYAGPESLTIQQFAAYDKLMRTFHKVFPYGQVAGHYMTSNDGKVDPGFDVPEYSFTKFGHRNVIPENSSLWSTSTNITIDTITSFS